MQVTFLPSNTTIETSGEEAILRMAMRAGIHINASCGGAGVCDKCKVFLDDGELRGERFPDGAWKACASYPVSDVKIRVPVESEMDRRALSRAAPRKIASWLEAHGGMPFDLRPVVEKVAINVPRPDLSDSASDLDRLQRELMNGRLKGTTVEVDTTILFDLPAALREKEWLTTVSMMEGPRPDVKKLIRVEPGDAAGGHLALAFDIGTTTVSGQLIELTTGKILADVSNYNPQVSFGEDVISRMEFARKKDGLLTLQQKIIGCLNALIAEICSSSRCPKDSISLMTAAGNTVMTHLLLGLETGYLRTQPYVPVATHLPPVRAKDIGIALPPHVYLFLAPCVASYVGGDITAGVVGVGVHRSHELTLFIDIGTNGEIVLGNQDWMACAACSAGPAFEGGGIMHGMRATTGAVEAVHIHPETFEPMILTIGGKKAKGICGSGIISLMAGLFMVEAIDRQGRFRRNLKTGRIRPGRDGWEYVVIEKGATATGRDIVFTEADIENLIRAKGAMFAGYQTLLESVGMDFKDLERVVLAGNFGSYLDLEQAVTIGLLPDIPRDRFFFVGNSSLAGARAMAMSIDAMKEVSRSARMMTHFDLSGNPHFMENYVSALFLPHTDAGLFPSVRIG
ncbi:ASKHA domain-containing protein [Dissulfurimicrobium hydrothermale]|uniref:ASKHA domain-containing protein n=1 Tax=Dissulfurimicrobium hydrothermale TaxID=1750598 RepID=UPI001EDB8A34|nr:ASKHA domain-containing protein [Dissulfurimicrobium hydrothermale]UKL13470.1 ASKHA domain-containing protein [Dissulfurimicrobium hydrothermale]